MARRPNITRRNELLDELQALVLQDGFDCLRVGALADRLHCSRSTLYKLAPSKAGLITVVASRFIGQAIFAALEAAARAEKYADKLEAYYDEVERWRGLGSDTFWRDLGENRSTTRLLLDARSAAFEVVRDLVDEGIAAGEFRECNASSIASLVVGTRPLVSGDGWQPPHSHNELFAEIRRLIAAENAA